MATATVTAPSTKNPFLKSLISDYRWAKGDTVRYFLDPSGGSWSTAGAGKAFDAAAKAWNAVANLTFAKTGSAAKADIPEVLVKNGENGSLGEHFLPNADGLGGTFNSQSWAFTAASNARGGVGFLTFLHELGHALGLNHNFEGRPFPGVTDGDPYDEGSHGLNQGMWTVMTYNDSPDLTGVPPAETYGYSATPMAFDIAAAQALYGANTKTARGANVYALPTANKAGTFFACIWDAAGVDTISGAAAEAGCTIDLRAATLKNAEGGGGYLSHVGDYSAGTGIFGGFTIAHGVVIERATGSAYDDVLIGNAADNRLTGGKGADTLTGGTGKDTFVFAIADIGGGADVIKDFQRGADKLDLTGFLTAGCTITYVKGHVDVDVTRGGKTLSIDVYGTFATTDILAKNLSFDVTGDAAANTLTGGGANDVLRGGGGVDVLAGGAGRDTLDGGVGADRLSGGSGADLFVFAPGETGAAKAGSCDRIADFSVKDGDRIDLTAFDTRFTFVGAAAFDGTAGALRSFQASGLTFVAGDLDGDRKADFVIQLEGTHTLAAPQFIL